jgi:hypothetical protein
MSELEERLNAVLSNPGELDRLAKMARQLMQGDAPEPQPSRETGPGLPAGAAKLLRELAGGKKPPLLDAIGPYLAEGRRERLGRALRLASAARTALPALRELGGFRGL